MKQKLNILFYADVLCYGLEPNAYRSGVFFVALNILKCLAEKDFIKITFDTSYSNFDKLRKFLEIYFPDKCFNIVDLNCSDSYISKLYLDLKNAKSRAKKEKKNVKKFFYQVLLWCIYLIHGVDYICACMRYSKLYDAYFTPAYNMSKTVRKCTGIKKFVFLHDFIPFILPDLHPDSGKDSWFNKMVRGLSPDWYYFTNSECTRNDCLKYCPQIDKNKIFTALLACDEHFKPADDKMQQYVKNKYNIPMDKKYVFSLCTLEPRKNLIRAVKTFVEFIKKDNIDDMVFVLGGGHWDMFIDKLNSEIEDLGDYKDKIIKAGYIEDEDLPALYSGAHWVVYTSVYEGFGLPPLEAMASGCPVITSNNSSLPEVVGDAGLTVNPYSEEEHIMAYEKYYYDSNLRQENKIKGLERAKLFSWQKCTDIIVNQMFNAVSKE